MKKNNVFAIALVLLGVSLACSLAGPPAPGTEAPGDLTAPAPPASTGINIVVGNVSFVIPAELASSATSQTFPRAEGQDVAPWDVTPGHTAFTLQDYAMKGSYQEPQIFLYPASDYALLSERADESLKLLKNILAAPDRSYAGDFLPQVPFFNAAQEFWAQEEVIHFASGSGVRIVTQYGQDVSPYNNGGLIYEFEGLSGDGKYYVIAILPTSLPFLPADGDPASPLPAVGVPFPPADSLNSTTFDTYYNAVTEKIGAASPDSFAPTLDSLDTLMASLKIAP